MAVGCNFSESSNNISFRFVVHGEIRIIPIAEHSQPNKSLFLNIHLLQGILATSMSKFGITYFLACLTFFLLHVVFDRQAMTVPSWNIRSIIATKLFGFHDYVFQCLVDGMTKMKVAIGVGWAIMKDKFRPSCILLTNLAIEINTIPFLEHVGFPLRQVCLHRKLGIRKI